MVSRGRRRQEEEEDGLGWLGEASLGLDLSLKMERRREGEFQQLSWEGNEKRWGWGLKGVRGENDHLAPIWMKWKESDYLRGFRTSNRDESRMENNERDETFPTKPKLTKTESSKKKHLIFPKSTTLQLGLNALKIVRNFTDTILMIKETCSSTKLI